MSASPDVPAQVMNTKPLFKLMVEKKASDLFFSCNAPVKIKIEGKIFPVNKQVLSPETVRQAALGLMTAEQIEYFNEELEIDFALSEPGHFRRDVAQHHRGIAALVEDVDAEAAEPGFRNREIDLQLLVEVLDLLLSHQSQRRLAHGLGAQDLLVDRMYLAFDLDLDGRVAGEKQIRRLLFDHQFEQRLGVHHLSRQIGRRSH